VRGLAPGSVDHVVGDPPYDEKTHTGAVTNKGGGQPIDIDFDPLPPCETFVPDLLRCTRRWILQFCTSEMTGDYKRASGDEKFQRDRADRNYRRAQWWVRTNGMPEKSGKQPAAPGECIATLHSHRWESIRWNGGGHAGHYIGPIATQDERLGHPTQKPEWLMLELLRRHTDAGETVLDWCGGVATTGVAALRLGRRFLGRELRGPCPDCGADFPAAWEADLRRRVLALDPGMRPCPHGRTNYWRIGRARLAHVAASAKQRELIAV
jgi:hypothetical protein